jgi:hypothetical protein
VDYLLQGDKDKIIRHLLFWFEDNRNIFPLRINLRINFLLCDGLPIGNNQKIGKLVFFKLINIEIAFFNFI